MSLILTRKKGEAVQVGEHLVTVVRVDASTVRLKVARRVHNCNVLDMVILEPGVTITMAAVSRSIARLAFDAPKHIKIMRTELEAHADHS